MAKTAAALHILVKQEAEAKVLLEKLKKGRISSSLLKNTPSALQAETAAIWVNSGGERW